MILDLLKIFMTVFAETSLYVSLGETVSNLHTQHMHTLVMLDGQTEIEGERDEDRRDSPSLSELLHRDSATS